MSPGTRRCDKSAEKEDGQQQETVETGSLRRELILLRIASNHL